MYWLSYSLLATTLWIAYWQNSVAGAEAWNKTEETALAVDPKENDIFFQPLLPEPISTGLTENRTGESNSESNVTTSDEVSLKSDQKRDAESITFKDIKPFLLFPFLPYLFPPREKENMNSRKEEFSAENDTAKIDRNPTAVKPFIFFDFAFNIRQIPINNATEKLNDSKTINVTQLSINDADDTKMDSMKNRRRRNTKLETPGFFDDAPLFADSELDEFLPKPDLFFPDLPFHHRPVKKLSRRKRDQKKEEIKNDLKSFFDAFDEAFMRTKRELEWTNPILNFLRGSEQSFDEEKKEADALFSQLPDTQEKPSVKWRIQRNFKRLNNDRQSGSAKPQDSPTIIVDKVVKIGEFHVHDDRHDKSKKKRGLFESKSKILGRDKHDEMNSNSDQDTPRSIFELIKEEGTKRKKRYQVKHSNTEEENHKEADSNGNKSSPEVKDTFQTASAERLSQPVKTNTNNTEKLYNLMKMFDALKGKMEVELKNNFQPKEEKIKVSPETTDLITQQDLKNNLTELLQQFMMVNKSLKKPTLMKTSPLGEREDSKVVNWAEKEKLQNTNALEKGSRERRQEKEAYFESEYENEGKKERQIAELHHLLLNVTIPTLLAFGVILIICFFSLQTKGKICTSLFKPRQVLIVNDEGATQMKSSGSKKIQAI